MQNVSGMQPKRCVVSVPSIKVLGILESFLFTFSLYLYLALFTFYGSRKVWIHQSNFYRTLSQELK